MRAAPMESWLNWLVSAALAVALASAALAFYPEDTPRSPGISLAPATDHDLPAVAHPAGTFSWHIPEPARGAEPLTISPGRWRFDFGPVEERLAQIDHHQGGLAVDQETLTLLEPVAEPLLNAMQADPQVLPRLAVLTEKSFAGNRGAALSQLLTGYLRYVQAARDHTSAIENSEQLQQLVRRQHHFLGEANARALFGESNRTKAYLLQRRAIQRDPALSTAQKQAALEALRTDFETSSEKRGGLE